MVPRHPPAELTGMFGLLSLFVGAFLASWGLTGMIRRFAISRALLDIPNDRSSHTVPTPRGGGLAIASVVLLGMTVAVLLGWIGVSMFLAFGIGGAAVAAIGWLDDLYHVRPGTRVVWHLIAAGSLVYWVGGLPAIEVAGHEVNLGAWGIPLAVLGVAWSINLYNFMDGIDGLAGGVAVVAGLLGGAMLWVTNKPDLALISLLVAVAAGGFLLWNWAPAKVFMGDTGSGFLGYTFAALAVTSEVLNALPVSVWLLLFGVLVFDTTVTLVRRIFRGEAWHAAHRKHAYQRAVLIGWTHAQVSTAVVLLTTGLGVLAWLGARWMEWQIPALLIGFVLLTMLYRRIEQLRPME